MGLKVPEIKEGSRVYIAGELTAEYPYDRHNGDQSLVVVEMGTGADRYRIVLPRRFLEPDAYWEPDARVAVEHGTPEAAAMAWRTRCLRAETKLEQALKELATVRQELIDQGGSAVGRK